MSEMCPENRTVLISTAEFDFFFFPSRLNCDLVLILTLALAFDGFDSNRKTMFY